MKHPYKDILDRIDEPPRWFDEHGVPRYDEFSPRALGHIYHDEAALAEVSCQVCGRRFSVSLSEAFAARQLSLSDAIRLGRIHYGDPPNVGCCHSGPSMSSIMHEILEYWSFDHEVTAGWRRDSTFEGPVAEAPLDPPDTVAEVLDAVKAGAKSIVVKCTSGRNRFDLAGRTTAAMAGNAHTLVVCPPHSSVSAILDGVVPGTEVGYGNGGHRVTVADFSRVKEIDLTTIESVVLLAAPRRHDQEEESDWRGRVSRLQAERKNVWTDAAAWLATEARDKVKVEFALAHSSWMIAFPDIVVQAAGRITDIEA